MGDFKRGLDQFKWSALEKLAAEGPNWWTDLLSLWVPSGQQAGDYGLRLALRDGNLNFYRRGQSVALVRFGRRRGVVVEARMEIHAKYVWADSQVEEYAQLRDHTAVCKGVAGHAHYAGLLTLKEWIANAEERTGSEKCGVDMVVGNNPTVIDLEMGIPAWGSRTSALRVDIAALDVTGGEPQLVLWEAKPLNAGALRAREGDGDIVGQMEDYREYLETPGHRELVGEAYVTTCCALLRFAAMAGREIKLHPLIRQVADARRLEVSSEPRLAVFQGVKWFEGKPELVKHASGWTRYREKLRAKNIRVADGKNPAELRLEDVA